MLAPRANHAANRQCHESDDVGKGEEELHFDREDLYTRSLRQFHAAIRGEGQPSATGEDGVWSLAAAEAALQSAKSGKAVRIDPKLGSTN